jgi:hypothetical protein
LAGGPKKLGLVCLCFLADGRRKKNRREGKVDRQVWRRDKATVEERIESTFELGRRVENFAAGGGKDGRHSGGCRAETEQRQRRKRKGDSQGLACDFRKLQGPLGKKQF